MSSMSEKRNFNTHNRIVIKVGSSSLTHLSTGKLDLNKLEILVRELANLRNMDKDVVLVSSGAIMVGMSAIDLHRKPRSVSVKQACASIGQARLMMIYQKLFSEYNQLCSQVLMTKHTMTRDISRFNAKNTFEELLDLGAIPIVNENDTVSTDEIKFGDNDSLSAVVASLIDADLLILLSDIDGMYTDDPHLNPEAQLIREITDFDETLEEMAKDSISKVGTGGMASKLRAAKMAAAAGVETVIASASDFHIIPRIVDGELLGTHIHARSASDFTIRDYLEEKTEENI